ncbi:MAG: V-type ATPase subunit [Deltaproteobacteria bacterium]
MSGRISVLEARFLPREFFMNMISQERIEDIVPYLQDTFLKDYLAPGAVREDFGAISDRCFYDMALSLRGNCPSTIPVDIFLLQSDYLNLKSALTGTTTFPFPMSLFTQEMLSAIAHEDYTGLPQSLRESAGWTAGDVFQVDSGILDIMLDGSYLRHLLSLANGIESEMVSIYVKERVLAYIIIVLWRAANQGIPLKRYRQHLLPLEDFTPVAIELIGINNPETWAAVIGGIIGDLFDESLESYADDRISSFDLKVTNYLSGIVRDGRLQTAGPERVFSFLAGLNVEMQNLKLVITGRLNRIDQGLLKERLKDCYV